MASPTTKLQYTPIDAIPKIRDQLKASFAAGKLRHISKRKEQLLQLAYMIQDNMDQFIEAFQIDLGRPKMEAVVLELNNTIKEAIEAYNSVDKWAKPTGVPLSLQFTAMKPTVYKQPKGVALIIGPFNFPVLCSIAIMAGAIAAGCPTVVKMSEGAPNVSSLMADLFPKYLDPECFAVINGGIPETSALLELQWDHIVFTGSSTVGKIVATAAAKHLTPVTLELGGQSPTIVDPRADLKSAARRILWGKMSNAGQACTAPNHVFVPQEGQDALVEAFKEVYASFYPEGARESQSFARIASDQAFSRLKSVLEGTKGEVIAGGETDASTKFIAPTIVKDVKMDDSLMQAELFGPILAIVPVKDFDEAIKYINAGEHPLALYLFTDDAQLKKKVIENTNSGAVLCNETLVHIAVPGLPFGGHGSSGYGAHTGKFSFDLFTHQRSSLDSPRWVDLVFSWRFPPYSDSKLKQGTMMQPKIPGPRPKNNVASRVRRFPLALFLLLLLSVALLSLVDQERLKLITSSSPLLLLFGL